MAVVTRVIDNRVFVLGLDSLFRDAMKREEATDLLGHAREVASVLEIEPADVPVEGYYSESAQLTEYFRLIRALQCQPASRAADVSQSKSFQRLSDVLGSQLFGTPASRDCLFPTRMDSLSLALRAVPMPNWSISTITEAARQNAIESDDCSLVALAALTSNPVVLTATRESVVLYATVMAGSAYQEPPEYLWVWNVDPTLQERAGRFVGIFNQLFGDRLPAPLAENAQDYWDAHNQSEVIGRCVRIGFDDSVRPINHYHWAIDDDDPVNPEVREFWDASLWTTERYAEELFNIE